MEVRVMLVIGVGLVFLGYSFGFWSYAGIRGYNITLGQVFSTKGPPGITGETAQQAQQKQSKAHYSTGTTQAQGTTTAGGRG